MTKSAIHIRPLAAPDAAAYKAMRLQAIADSPAAVWPTLEEEGARTLDEVRARIAMTAYQVVFGAFSDGELVGLAGLRREPLAQVAHKAIVWGVFVAPDYRRAGLARQLIERLAGHARDNRILQLHLAVNTDNQRARRLYQSIGFVSYGIEPCAMRVGDRFYDEEHMVLRIGGPCADGDCSPG
jgi:RimJ/RimL family protein N-acetyltransferase